MDDARPALFNLLFSDGYRNERRLRERVRAASARSRSDEPFNPIVKISRRCPQEDA